MLKIDLLLQQVMCISIFPSLNQIQSDQRSEGQSSKHVDDRNNFATWIERL